MLKIRIINGANLNLLGAREPEIYGTETMEACLARLKRMDGVEISLVQSNVEGELVNQLQAAAREVDAIVLNAGGYAHTSVVIADCIRAIETPVVCVHLSNIFDREAYRQTDLVASACVGMICGFGTRVYDLAVEFFMQAKR